MFKERPFKTIYNNKWLLYSNSLYLADILTRDKRSNENDTQRINLLYINSFIQIYVKEKILAYYIAFYNHNSYGRV